MGAPVRPMFEWLSPARTVADFLDAGGWVLWTVLLAGVLMWTLIVERWLWFLRAYPQARARASTLWQQRPDRRDWVSRRLRAAMIGRASQSMSATLPLIRTLIAACPMLGLLGTVTGMIEVFDVMALTGTGDAQAMAAGVSRATVPTMAGMIVGISGLLPMYRLNARVRGESERFGELLEAGGDE